MLFLYQSNRLEQLGELFCGMTQAMPLADPFAAETVIVQSRGMGRWITLDVARKAGIAANIDFALPAAFAWRLMQKVMPDLPRKSAFVPEVLAWRLLALLPSLSGEPFGPVLHYLEGGEAAAFELAGKIADIFDQYLVFRPDWIRAWEAGELLGLGEDEAWQAALWRRLAESDPGRHRVRMLDQFFADLKPEHLPPRVTLFGIASLAPMYLALVKRLSQLTDVCLFTLNPCEAYWGDIVDARRLLKLRQAGDLFATQGHPLLSSLGKQGRDFFELIAEDAELDAKPLFAAPKGDGLLARLQRDILQLNDPSQLPRPFDPADASIEVHACHGPMRELEALKDRLLAMFAADPKLSPADVAVLTPDINAYAPYIDAVFGRRDDAPNIPYSIADRRVEREQPLLSTFAAVLKLADSRFAADEVLALLDCPALLARFDLADADLAFIQDWVRDAGIRWGRDAAHKASLGLPAEAAYTWRWGLDRLLLGTVLPPALAGDDAGLFAGLLPYTAAQGQLGETLARFAGFYDALDALADAWSQPAAPQQWAQRFHQACDRLFLAEGDDEAALELLREALAELAEDADLAGFGQPVGLAVARDWLLRKLSSSSAQGFLSGGVTFCAMVPMRSIPFQALCLIGMNDGAYPRDERPVSFDLVARNPRRGDRSRRFDDRYLFLEAILSARGRLYLSYVGQSARSGEPLPPSPLVSELLDTLSAMCGEDMAARLTLRHPLQPFSPRAFDGGDARLASFEPAFAAALAAPPAEPAPFVAPLPGEGAATVVNLHDFIRFWQNPARAWLADRLALRVAYRGDAQPAREPFAMARDASQALRRQLVEAMLHGKPPQPVRQRVAAAGLLPCGELGQAWLQEEGRASVRLAGRLPGALRGEALPPQPVHLEIAGFTLVGELYGLRPEGRLDFIVGKMNAAQRVALWLSHLILCAARPAGVAPHSACYDDAGSTLLHDEIDAAGLLAPWLARWKQGQAQPLPFFGRTSWAYAEALAKSPDKPDKALAAAWQKWEPNFILGDGVAQKDEPAIALAFRHQSPLEDPLFAQLAETLLLPLAERLQGGQA
ncbi:exodeoxyribonuclease V subunit gamma [Chromobacterium violaceum]|uniref:exodeoxyribonuclease V subunit gamma n=1 Tax=Chromobacterium violaceum TaxID=536 RepID=UPI0006545C3B|nr:exodeoxyribonuclease V subunit gamma [Chromobacterium violaceum]KMN48070.1 exodeoxyribonuclease V subunit gamma [Chromobacterium violaceum]KMN86461.1 exodeoxyribonuclease V subunit gamma [Chromobacterium violaceum]KMN89944.1 exodeoxyribonuclease V subunit gamma [Chromobacterium violaceum]KMO02142.1 exodeoxyribonuclease V subunit gamma [Chromobacterium violaceum]